MFAYLQSGEVQPGLALAKLCQFDSTWYARITEHGYQGTVPPTFNADQNNAGFFPGFPAFVTIVRSATGLPTKAATLIAAQLSCVVFWTYVFLFFRRWLVPIQVAVVGTLFLAAQPCAFYLIAGYSESLFLASLLGFLYWSNRGGLLAWWLAASHGFVMTATRMVGFPVVVGPFLVSLLMLGIKRPHGTSRSVDSRSMLRAAGLAATASLGGLFFFAHCARTFGRWDLYMQTQKLWGVSPDYLAVFYPEIYRIFLPEVSVGGFLDPKELSRLSVPLTAAVLSAVIALEICGVRRRPGCIIATRAVLYWAALAMFYTSICGVYSVRMNSMIRYVFPVYVMLVLAVVHLLTSCGLPRMIGECV
jgi:hypothetical protein